MKNIPRYRIGNDLTVFWAIHNRDGSPYDLKDKEIHLYATNERGREEVKATLSDLPDGSQNNVIRWDYRGETQRVLGLYTLTVEIQSSEEHREITRDYCEAFTLVSRSDMENEEEEANISVGGDLILSSKLDIYRFEAVGVDVSEIKIKIDEIQGAITKLESEINLKASIESVEEFGKSLTQIRKSIADLTLSVNDLEAEIELKASVESVNILKDSIGSIKNSVAELSIRADEITAEIELKASREEITLLGDSIQKVDKAVAQQIIKVEGLEASIENLVTRETFDAVTGELDEAYTSVKTTVDGVVTTIKDQSGEIASIKESVSGVSVSLGTVKNDIDALRNQVDGVTESYFYPYSPTLSNEPAASWIREGKESEHKGDTFTNTSEDGEGAGRSWRWLQSENGEWGWKAISDTDAIKALQMAAKAQETADGKCTTFYAQPANYSFGDLWFVHNNNYPPYKKGEILSATQDSDYFDLSHWEPKASYTEAINELDNTMKTSFRDGVLDDAERNTIAENLKNLSKEQSALDSRYNTLIINADFADGELKEEYRSIKREYDSAYNSLVSVVERILLASTEDLASLFEEYETKSEAYESALSEYNSCEERVREALMGSMNYAHVYLDNIAKDGVITPVEKEQLFEIYRNIAREYDTTVGNAYNYKIWKYAEGGESETIGNNGQDGRYEAYLRYKAAYAPILSAFTSPLWGFDKMSETTKLEDSLTVSRLKGYFEDYYSAHGELWNIFSAITASIEEAQKKAEETLKKLTDCLTPEEMTTLIGRGVVLSTIIATKDADGKITAGMNATNLFVHSEHGRVVIAGGVKDIEDWNTASGRIYEDGHFVINSGEISDEVRIGNATLKNVIQATSQFDVVAVPYKDKNGETAFLPLFTVNRNSDGEVVSVSSVYDFVGNKNIWAAEEISANGLNLGGGGSGGGGSTTLDGLIDVILSSPQSGNILVFNGTHWVNKPQSELVPEVDLSDYYTKQQTQNAITSALSPYIKATDADGKYAALASFNALQSSFDRLYSALNDDTSGVINTWNEVVDFVNEYSGSEDLSTILGKMNTDINARVKVSDFDTWKTDVFNPLSVTVTNLGNKVDTNTANINKLLGWFNVDADGNLFTTYNFYSTKEISANGISQGTGGGGSGLISSVLGVGSLGATLTNDNSVVFNAYATNEIYKATQGHASRIGVLESQVGQLTTQSTKVSVSDLQTTGTKIATITVDGVAHEVKGDFLPTSGGTINTDSGYGLTINRTNAQATLIAFKNQTNLLGFFGFTTSGMPVYLNSSATQYNILHSGNYSNYALPLTGGTIKTDRNYYPLVLATSAELGQTGIKGMIGTTDTGALIFSEGNTYLYNYKSKIGLGIYDGIAKFGTNTLLHSGNVGDYAVISNQRKIDTTITNLNQIGYGYIANGWQTAGPAIAIGSSDGYTMLLQQRANGYGLYVSYKAAGGQVQPWKTLAFTDSIVDSAQTLTHSNGTVGATTQSSGIVSFASHIVPNNDSQYYVGVADKAWYAVYTNGVWAPSGKTLYLGANNSNHMLVNSSGNVTIGSSNLASTTTKLYVDGGIRFAPRTIWGQSFDGTGNVSGNLTIGKADVSYTTQDYLYFWKGDGTYRHRGLMGVNEDGSFWNYYNPTTGAYYQLVVGPNGLKYIQGISSNSFLINPSGNVTIGRTDLAGTNVKLYVDGHIRLGATGYLFKGENTVIDFTAAGAPLFGYGSANAGLDTRLSGKNVYITYGRASTFGLILNSSGNVTIGNSDLAGTSAKLYVDGNILLKRGNTVKIGPGYGNDINEMYNYIEFNSATNGLRYYGGTWASSRSEIGHQFIVNTSLNAAMTIYNNGNVLIGTTTDSGYKLDVNGTFRATGAVTFDSTLTIAGATTHNGIAYFGGTTYYINTSGNANFNAISGRSLQVDSAAFNDTIHSNEYSGSVAKWSITKDGAASFASLSNGGLLETSTLRVSSTSTFTGKTNHNGGIGAASLNVSGTSTLSGHVGIGTSPHSTYALYVDGSLRCGPIDGGTASLGALYSNTHVPNLSETYDLGSDAYRWASIYGVGADFSGNVTVKGTLNADDIEGGDIYITASSNLFLTTISGYLGAPSKRWAIDGYGNYKGQSLYINPRDNDNEIITDNNKKKTHGFPREGVAVFVNGDIAATGEISANALNQGSDIRFKNQLGDITLDLGTIANAPMFRFTWTNKENSRVQIGTSAQYWKDSARELVSVDKDDFHRLDYATLGVLIGVTLGKTVKNHEDRIEELEKEVVELKEENRRLRYEC